MARMTGGEVEQMPRRPQPRIVWRRYFPQTLKKRQVALSLSSASLSLCPSFSAPLPAPLTASLSTSLPPCCRSIAPCSTDTFHHRTAASGRDVVAVD